MKKTTQNIQVVWCSYSEKYPEYQNNNILLSFLVPDAILQFLLAGLQEKTLSTAAANSLQCISTMCREQMVSHFQGLVQIVSALETFQLSNDAAIGLLKGGRFSIFSSF